MDRRAFMKRAGVAGTGAAASMTLAAPVVAQEAPSIKWRLASGYPRQLDTIFGSATVFADAVRAATDGQFDIEVSAAGEVVDAFDGLAAVRDGTVDMISTASNYFWETDPAFGFGAGVPFGLNQRMMNAWLYEGKGLELLPPESEFLGRAQALHGLEMLPGRLPPHLKLGQEQRRR